MSARIYAGAGEIISIFINGFVETFFEPSLHISELKFRCIYTT